MKRFDPYEPENPWRDGPRFSAWQLVACAVAAFVAPIALILVYDFWRVL